MFSATPWGLISRMSHPGSIRIQCWSHTCFSFVTCLHLACRSIQNILKWPSGIVTLPCPAVGFTLPGRTRILVAGGDFTAWPWLLVFLHLLYLFLPLDCDNVEHRASVFHPKHRSFLTRCLPYSRHSINNCQGREVGSLTHHLRISAPVPVSCFFMSIKPQAH